MAQDRTKDFAIQHSSGLQQQTGTVAADLYGGANTIVLGAGSRKRYDELNIDDVPETVRDSSRNGTQEENYEEVMGVRPTFDLSGPMFTYGMTDDLAWGLGYEMLDGPKDIGDATNFRHMLLFNNLGKDQRDYTAAEQALVPGYAAGDKINTYKTLAKDMGPSTEIAKNATAQQLEITGQSGNPIMIKASGNAETVVRDENHTGVSNWSDPLGAFLSRFKMFTGTLKVGKNGEAAAVHGIQEFSLKVNFGMATDLQPTGTSNGGLSRAEPCSTGVSEVTFSIKVHKHTSDMWKDWEQDKSSLFSSLEFTQGDYFLGMYLPNLQITSAPVDTADGSSVMVNFRGYLPTGVDPFATERTVDTVEWVPQFPTSLYMITQDQDQTNWLRSN